jgi:hypothetical protein
MKKMGVGGEAYMKKVGEWGCLEGMFRGKYLERGRESDYERKYL